MARVWDNLTVLKLVRDGEDAGGREEKRRTVASDFLLYGLLAQYNTGIFALQIRNPMKNAPVWLAPLFHGSIALIFGIHGALLYMGGNDQSLIRSNSGK